MDNIFSLTDAIAQDLNEETASSNISYIPGGFTTTRQAMLALATKKPKWKIDILEKESKYDVNFEDVLRIIINKDDYEHFNSKVFNIKGLKEVDLSTVLNEAAQEDVQQVVAQLESALKTKLRDQFVIENSFYLASAWLRMFGGSAQPNSARVLLSISNFDSDVKKLIEKIKLNYLDDVGEMERAIEAIYDKTPMNDLDIFSGYDYLIAQDYVTVYQGIKMRFICAVNMAWQPVEEIWIDNIDVIDELAYYRKFVKPLHKSVKPVNGFFNTAIFEAIADIIKDLE